MNPAQNDRRSRIRFPLALCVRFARAGRNTMDWLATTADISSCGVYVLTEHAPDVGTKLRMWVEWPAVENAVLVVTGKVRRSDPGGFALEMTKHAMINLPKKSFQVQPDTR